jgi:hypothetical protein
VIQRVENFVSNVFMFLACFVALQVMMKGAWWGNFYDGAQS